MICPNCKKVYNNRVTFCISCGTELVPDENAAEGNGQDEGDIAESLSLPEKSAIKMSSGVFEDNSAPENAGSVRKINMTPSLTKRTQSYEPVAVKKINVSGRSRVKNIAAGAGSAVLAALTAASLVLVFGTLAGRGLTDEKNIANGVKNIDLLSVPAAEIGIYPAEDADISPDATLEEAVAAMTKGSGVNGGNIRGIYESSTITGYLSSAAADYALYLRNGEQPDKITAEKVKGILDENVSVISKNTGFKLSDEDIALAYKEIDRSEKIFDMLSVNSLESRAGDHIRLLRAYISLPALAAEIAAAAGFVLLIALLNRNAKKVLRYAGWAFSATGLAALVFTFMFSMQIGLFSGNSGLRHEIIKGAAAAASDGMYRTGAVFLAAGIAALLTSAIKLEGKNYNNIQ